MRPSSAAGVWARWGLLASAFVLCAALIVASWANYRSARNATGALHHGQAGVLLGAVRDALPRPGSGEEPPDLERVLSERSADGLRYVALLSEEGEITYSVGEAHPTPLPALVKTTRDPGMQLVEVGSRVRVLLSFHPRRTAPGMPADRDRPEGGSSRHDRGEGPRPGGMVLEFEPVVASDLMQRAERLRAFGVAAAVVMMLAAVVFWRMSRRYEGALRQLERERRLSLLGEMTAVLAHEIRNPLASLKGHAQLLAERLAVDSADRRKAERVISEAARLEELTTDLLDFARTGPLDLAPSDPSALVRAAAQEVAPEAFELVLSSAPASWRLDTVRMRQVLTNLLRNAHQASADEGRRPVVRLSVEGGALVITIRDFGGGLPQGQEARVFDPFFTTRASGTGLGLSVARRVVELHGGRIAAESHPDGGAVFRITLPQPQE